MSNLQVANTIIQQLGGANKLRAMIGAGPFLGDDNSVQFSFKGSRKANKCRITLDWTDTYTVQLFRYSPKYCSGKMVYELEGCYADMLIPVFESETGLYLRL